MPVGIHVLNKESLAAEKQLIHRVAELLILAPCLLLAGSASGRGSGASLRIGGRTRSRRGAGGDRLKELLAQLVGQGLLLGLGLVGQIGVSFASFSTE